MNEPPNPFPDFNNDSNANQLPTDWEEVQNFSPQRIQRMEAAKKQAGKLFVILLVVGIVLGGAVSIGVVKIMDQLGLTQNPQPTLSK